MKDSTNDDYDEFLGELDETKPCFAVYDFHYNKGEGDRNKICFFIWCGRRASCRLQCSSPRADKTLSRYSPAQGP